MAHQEYSVSIIIPCKNEKGTIEQAVRTCPNLGSFTELIFVEGHSHDGTFAELVRIQNKYPHKNIVILQQTHQGKADAVYTGFAHARGDILIILDADLTVDPSELHQFYKALQQQQARFINGCRLTYPREPQAMPPLNYLVNRAFAYIFSWLLGQKVRDTLCGTKALFKQDYLTMTHLFKSWQLNDPFSDFELLLGAAHLKLKICNIPINYKRRIYGSSQIRRWYHGLTLAYITLCAIKINIIQSITSIKCFKRTFTILAKRLFMCNTKYF